MPDRRRPSRLDRWCAARSVNGQTAGISDAFAVWDESALTIRADEESEILLFDLPPV